MSDLGSVTFHREDRFTLSVAQPAKVFPRLRDFIENNDEHPFSVKPLKNVEVQKNADNKEPIVSVEEPLLLSRQRPVVTCPWKFFFKTSQ